MLIRIMISLATVFSTVASVVHAETSNKNSNGWVSTVLSPLVIEAANGHNVTFDVERLGRARATIRDGYILTLGDGNECVKDLIFTREITEPCELSGPLKNPFSIRVEPDYVPRSFGIIISPGKMVEVYAKRDKATGNITGLVIVSKGNDFIFAN